MPTFSHFQGHGVLPTSLLERKRAGTLASLIPSDLRFRTTDAGEILTDLFTLFCTARAHNAGGWECCDTRQARILISVTMGSDMPGQGSLHQCRDSAQHAHLDLAYNDLQNAGAKLLGFLGQCPVPSAGVPSSQRLS